MDVHHVIKLVGCAELLLSGTGGSSACLFALPSSSAGGPGSLESGPRFHGWRELDHQLRWPDLHGQSAEQCARPGRWSKVCNRLNMMA